MRRGQIYTTSVHRLSSNCCTCSRDEKEGGKGQEKTEGRGRKEKDKKRRRNKEKEKQRLANKSLEHRLHKLKRIIIGYIN